MGIGSRSKAWRFTDVNKDYSVGLDFNSEEKKTRRRLNLSLVNTRADLLYFRPFLYLHLNSSVPRTLHV